MRPLDLWEMLAAVPLHHSVDVEVDGLTAEGCEVLPSEGGTATLDVWLPPGWRTTPEDPTDDMLAAGMSATPVPLPPAQLRAIWSAILKAVNDPSD